jgi:hypothetical protein
VESENECSELRLTVGRLQQEVSGLSDRACRAEALNLELVAKMCKLQKEREHYSHSLQHTQAEVSLLNQQLKLRERAPTRGQGRLAQYFALLQLKDHCLKHLMLAVEQERARLVAWDKALGLRETEVKLRALELYKDQVNGVCNFRAIGVVSNSEADNAHGDFVVQPRAAVPTTTASTDVYDLAGPEVLRELSELKSRHHKSLRRLKEKENEVKLLKSINLFDTT